jgi:hypothetical protein
MTPMVYEKEYLHIVWVYAGARNVWVKKLGIFYLTFLFLVILRDERFIFVSSSFRRGEIDNKKL